MNTDKKYHIFKNRRLVFTTDSYNAVLEFLKKNRGHAIIRRNGSEKLSDTEKENYSVLKKVKENGDTYFVKL